MVRLGGGGWVVRLGGASGHVGRRGLPVSVRRIAFDFLVTVY